MEKQTPAMDLVGIVAKHRENGRKIPDIKLKRYIQDALELAIKTGLRFDIQDFLAVNETYLTFYKCWIDREGYGETLYKMAVEAKNISACRSLEDWKGRKPFMLDGKRIYVGREFQFCNRKVKCTSFAKDGSYITACSYRDLPEDSPKKIERVCKIRRHELKLPYVKP